VEEKGEEEEEEEEEREESDYFDWIIAESIINEWIATRLLASMRFSISTESTCE